MRLRPSGRQGPVATSLAAFRNYQRDEAWTWEHLALTRARPIAGRPGARRPTSRRSGATLLAEQGAAAGASAATWPRCGARLAAAKPAQGMWDAKQGPGRLMEVELAAQTAALARRLAAAAGGAQIADGA